MQGIAGRDGGRCPSIPVNPKTDTKLLLLGVGGLVFCFFGGGGGAGVGGGGGGILCTVFFLVL